VLGLIRHRDRNSGERHSHDGATLRPSSAPIAALPAEVLCSDDRGASDVARFARMRSREHSAARISEERPSASADRELHQATRGDVHGVEKRTREGHAYPLGDHERSRHGWRGQEIA